MFGLFRKRRPKVVEPSALAPPANVSPAPERLITVVDVYGRSLRLSLDQWRHEMLVPNLSKAWHDPDQLYAMVITAVQNDLAADVDVASARLLAIEPATERAYITRAIVQMKLGRTREAHATLREARSKVGESGTLLTNEAKVFADEGDHATALATLDRALQLDPNQGNGLGWRVALAREASGTDGVTHVLLSLAALPQAWRPQLLLGQFAMQAGQRDEAMAWFDQVLAREPHGSDVMLIVSGELGGQGFIADAVHRIAPLYDEHRDDVRAGYNLLQAYLELGDATSGQALLERLFALKQPAHLQYLKQFSSQFDQITQTPLSPLRHAPHITYLTMALPPWLLGMHDMAWAAPPRGAGQPRIVLLPLAGVSPHAQALQGREDECGRLSRALPMLLLEQLVYCSDLDASFHLPVADGHNLVLFGQSASDEELEALAIDFHYAVEGEIAQTEHGFHVVARLRQLDELKTLARVERRFAFQDSGDVLITIAGELLRALGTVTSTTIEPRVPWYSLPRAQATQYLQGLTQALVLTLVNSPEERARLFGERNMYSWLQTLAISLPEHEPSQWMYITALAKARRFGSTIISEFEAPAVQRMRELCHMGRPAAQLLPLLAAVYSDNDVLHDLLAGTPPHNNPSYAAWCGRIAATFRIRPTPPPR